MGPRLGRVEYTPTARPCRRVGKASMGPRLGRVEYNITIPRGDTGSPGFNGATLRTRGIHGVRVVRRDLADCFNGATLRTRGIRRRLGWTRSPKRRFNGATLRTRGIRFGEQSPHSARRPASMGPRLGRVEYDSMEDGQQVSTTLLQWGHA